MTNPEFSFGNLDEVESRSFDLLPIGVYPLRALEMEMRDTKTGGAMLAAQFEVTSGPHEGRRVFHNFNVVNGNETAVEIALRDIKDWMIACGQDAGGQCTLPRIQALEGLPFMAKVGVEKDKSGQFEDKNKIARFLPPQDKGTTPAAPAAAAPQAPAAPAAPPAPGRKPWE